LHALSLVSYFVAFEALLVLHWYPGGYHALHVTFRNQLMPKSLYDKAICYGVSEKDALAESVLEIKLRNRNFCTLTCASLFLLSACTIGERKPYIIELPPQFESSARSINVKAPKSAFKDKHYNIALGDYQVINSRIEKFEREKNKFSIAVEEYKMILGLSHCSMGGFYLKLLLTNRLVKPVVGSTASKSLKIIRSE